MSAAHNLAMSTVKSIRERLNLTQAALAEKLGCTQSNVMHYERDKPDRPPQTVPPEMAKKLITVARESGIDLTMDQVYGLVPLPAAANDEGTPAAAGAR